MIRIYLAALVITLASTVADAGVQGKEVEYTAGDVTMKGYLAYDDSTESKRPGVLVVHEWWGHNEYARTRARMLAEMGYVALAVDMYGDGKQADHPEEAGAFSQATLSNLDSAEARFDAARKLLNHDPRVDATKNAAIGYCFGGGVVLHMARVGTDLDGVVSFHGSLGAKRPAEKGGIKARILVCTGGADPFVPADQVEAFRKEMDAAGATYEVKVYDEATHSFTNPGATEVGEKFDLPLVYDEEADKASWADAKAFLEELFSE